MATFNKIESWVEYLVEGANVGSDQFVVALTNSAPSASADSVLADITEISYTNCSSRNVTTTSSAEASGTHTIALQDLTLTASGGTVGPFRYVVLYDDTVAGDPLVGWWDYGSSITLADTETIDIDFAASTFTIT